MKKTIALLVLGLSLSACSPSQGTELSYRQSSLSDEGLLKSMAIYEGVSIGGLDMAGANKLVAKEILAENLEPGLDKEIKLTYKDKDYNISLRELGYYYDYDKAIDTAYKEGRQGDDEARLSKIKELSKDKKDIELSPSLNEDKARERLEGIRSETIVHAEGGDFSYSVEEDKVLVSSGKKGEGLNIEDAIGKLKKLDINKPEDIAMVSEDVLVDPEVQKMADSIKGPISSAVSYFNTWFWERAENVRVSTEEFNGLILMPGEVFSFNDYIGDTPYEKGYHDAVVIQGTTEMPGKGGGVCQTSTALYHSVLKAGLEVVERHPHTLIMPYSPGGLDASVDYGLIDFVFKNNYDFPILFKTYYIDQGNGTGEIHFEVWGDTDKVPEEAEIYSEWNYDVPYSTEYRQTEDGENVYGVVGSSWSAYREFPATGEVEYLGDTYYPAVNEVLNQSPEPAEEDYYEEDYSEDYVEDTEEYIEEELVEEVTSEEG